MNDAAFIRDIELNYALFWGTKSYEARHPTSFVFKTEFEHYFIDREGLNQQRALGDSDCARAIQALRAAGKENKQAIERGQGSHIIPRLRKHLSNTFGSFSASLYVVPGKKLGDLDAFASDVRSVPNARRILYFGELSTYFQDNLDIVGDYLAAIPESIQAINLYRCFPDSITPAEIIPILSRIPYHVRSISLRGIWGKDQISVEQVAEIIGNLPWHIRHVDMDFYSDVDFIKHKEDYDKILPRIKSTPQEAPAKFKALFSEAAVTPAGLLAGARALLVSYTMSTNSFVGRMKRFFSLHWGRHHLQEIAEIIRDIDAPVGPADKINTVQELMSRLTKIPLKNRNSGSLIRRIQYIEARMWAAEPEPMPAGEKFTSVSLSAPPSSSSSSSYTSMFSQTGQLPPGVEWLELSDSDKESLPFATKSISSIWDAAEGTLNDIIKDNGDYHSAYAAGFFGSRTDDNGDYYSQPLIPKAVQSKWI